MGAEPATADLPEATEVTAEMVLRYVIVPRPTASRMAAYATRRLGGTLPVDARRETGIGLSTGRRYEKALRILCARLALPVPPGAMKSFDVPDFAAAGAAGRHQRYHVNRGVPSPDCSLCASAATPHAPEEHHNVPE